jgi:RNA polymerase subunit RPABC4/transcription elongation factor Spt4
MTQACVSCGRALSERGRFCPNCGVLQSLKRDVADRMDALLGG